MAMCCKRALSGNSPKDLATRRSKLVDRQGSFHLFSQTSNDIDFSNHH
jgi:hypothetical protein